MMQSISVLHMNYLPFFQQAANKIFVKKQGNWQLQYEYW
jgi:hypothetical protein